MPGVAVKNIGNPPGGVPPPVDIFENKKNIFFIFDIFTEQAPPPGSVKFLYNFLAAQLRTNRGEWKGKKNRKSNLSY